MKWKFPKKILKPQVEIITKQAVDSQVEKCRADTERYATRLAEWLKDRPEHPSWMSGNEANDVLAALIFGGPKYWTHR